MNRKRICMLAVACVVLEEKKVALSFGAAWGATVRRAVKMKKIWGQRQLLPL